MSRCIWVCPPVVGLCLLFLLGACGQVAAKQPLADGAVPSDGASATDAAQLGPWSAPRLIAELSTASIDQDPALTADRQELIFSSNRPGSSGDDLWVATRAALNLPFSAPTLVANVNSAGGEQHPWISPDGMTLYFTSDRAGTADIYLTTRATRTGAWAPPVAVAELNSAAADQVGGLTPDGLTVMLVSDRGGPATGRDVYLATRPSVTQPWSVPSPVPALATAGEETSPSLAAGGTVVYLARDQDLYVSERTAGSFAAPRKIEELSTADPEGDPFVSEDQRTIVFSRLNDLYIATR